MSRTQVYELFKWFKDGHEIVENEKRPGRPVRSKTDKKVKLVRATVKENHQITIYELSEDFNISFESVQTILTDNIRIRHVPAKFVPKVLTADRKEPQVLSTAQDLLECVKNDDNFIKTILIHDESWVYGYDPQLKASLQCGRPEILQDQQKPNRAEAESRPCSPLL
uniref:Mos1 transposase HTH domain-containing protein n=1 Tax=Graphocephala atropunctata TaxID=36148 RepID=A0A1B6M0K7_9HEMI